MKSFIKTAVVISLCVAALLSLVSCGLSRNALFGTYENADGIFIFAKDGSMRYISGNNVILGSFAAEKNHLETMLNGTARKYEYSINGNTMTLYTEGSSYGEVYTKTGEAQASAAIKAFTEEKLEGIYASEGWFSKDLYAFSSDGTYKHSGSYKVTHGTYAVDGNILSLISEDTSEEYTIEVDNGLVFFTDPSLLSAGTLYSDVSDEYSESETVYSTAMSSLNAGKYDDAADKFASISGYFDSDEMVNESYYQKAYGLYESEKYEEALEVFSSLGSYKDSIKAKEDSQREIDLKNIEKISFEIVSKKSEAYVEGSRPANKPTMEFVYGIDVTNGGSEDITAMSLVISIKDIRGTLLSSFSVSGSVDIPAGKKENITVTNTLRDFSSVTMNDVALHLMDFDNLTIDIELDSVSFDWREVTGLNDERHIHRASEDAYSSAIYGDYHNDYAKISFGTDGTVTYTPRYNTAESVTYTGTYLIYKDEIEFNFNLDYVGTDLIMAEAELNSLIKAREYLAINDRLFIRDSSYTDVGGTFFVKE